MAAIGYQKPTPYLSGPAESFFRWSYPVTAGQTINEGDIVVLTGAGTVSRAASNTNSAIVGVADMFNSAIFYAGAGGSAAATAITSFFGSSTAGTAQQTGEPLNLHGEGLSNGVYLEMSLVQAWALTLNGAAVGLTLDGTSNYFVADTGATAVGSIVRLVEGVPNAQFLASGGVGDTGCRVLVRFNASVLAF